MRSKRVEAKEVREIGRKEAGKSRSFRILWIGLIEDVFQMEGKKYKDQEKLKMCRRKSMPERGRRFLARDRQLCLSQWQDEKRFEAAARNSAKEKRVQKEQ